MKAFSAHRHAFIGEEDLSAIASLGLQMVRLPLTWAAFADALMPLDQKIYGSHNPMTETTIVPETLLCKVLITPNYFVGFSNTCLEPGCGCAVVKRSTDVPVFGVPDPFYKDQAAFATIPRDWLAEFLVRCAKHGLRVLIDLHAFPGGSSQGTYNGVPQLYQLILRRFLWSSTVSYSTTMETLAWEECLSALPIIKTILKLAKPLERPTHCNTKRIHSGNRQVLHYLSLLVGFRWFPRCNLSY